jgi:hypothetical protein
MAADNLLSWNGEDGQKRCLLIVTDDEKHHKQVGYRKIVLCEMNEKDQWETVDTIDAINEMESFGIPPGMEP